MVTSANEKYFLAADSRFSLWRILGISLLNIFYLCSKHGHREYVALFIRGEKGIKQITTRILGKLVETEVESTQPQQIYFLFFQHFLVTSYAPDSIQLIR